MTLAERFALMPKAEDTGYYRVCPTCCARWDCSPFMVGMAREIVIDKCDGCSREKTPDERLAMLKRLRG